MKKIILFGLILISLKTEARNFYFSALSGDDNRSSTQAQVSTTPWATIAKLNSFFSSLLPGDSVLFKRGETFFGKITVNKSGTIDSRIVIGAYGTGAKPVFTSLITLGTPVETSTGSHIWTFPANSLLGSDVNVVTQNGTALPLARYPNLNATNKGYLKFETSTASSITDMELPLSPNWGGAEICVRVKQYTTNKVKVNTHSNTTLNTTAFTTTPAPGGGYFIVNDPKCLDQQGEWCYVASTKQIKMYSVGTPTGVIQAATSNNVIKSSTFSYFTLTDLDIRGANDTAVYIGVCSQCGANGAGGQGVTIKNCNFQYNEMALYISKHDNATVFGNTFSDSYGAGIMANNTGNISITYNNMQNINMIQGMGKNGWGIGIWFKGTDGLIGHNYIHNTGRDAIHFEGENAIVEYNHIDGFCNTMNDGAAIYTFPSGVRLGQIIRYNVIRNSGDARAGGVNPNLFEASGVYLDNGTISTLVLGNSIDNCAKGVFINSLDSNNTVRLNTIYNCIEEGVYIRATSGNDTKAHKIRNNVIFAKAASQMIYRIDTYNTSYTTMFTSDSNYLCRPVFEPNNINNAGSSSTGGIIRARSSWFSLKGGWDAAYPPNEAHSFKSPKGYDTLRYEVNTSDRDSSVILNYGSRDYTWLTARGVRVKGSVVLPAKSSLVLIRDTIVPLGGGGTPNTKPTVSLTSPANNSFYTAPASVSIAATASDADGTISIVRFYSGSTFIGSDASSPYTFTWSSVPVGGYSITAHAVDNSGDSTISSAISITVSAAPPPNTPPVVTLTSPVNGAIYTAPATITLTATATDADGTIAQVQFFNGATLLYTEMTSPYTRSWTGVAAGTYSITAKAIDNSGGFTISGAVSVTVQTAPPANTAPSVTLLSPTNNSVYGAPATVNMLATASDADGTVSQVQFYNGSTLLATDTDSPYVYTWSSVAAGSYNITAKATDNLGKATTSSVAGITVISNVPPTVSITSPADSATFSTPADVTINANASDIDGNVTVVNFYVDAVYVGSDSASPYQLSVSGYTTGTHTLRAKAIDNSGDTSTSAGVIIIVSPPAALKINVIIDPVLCFGGNATVTIGATGGTGPYSGDTGVHVVAAGSHTYIVTDFVGTKDTAILTITQPAVLTLSKSADTIAVYGGSVNITFTSTGGTAPKQYRIGTGNWQSSNVFTLYAGTYTAYVRDVNGCTTSLTFSLTQPTKTTPGKGKKHFNISL